MGKTHKDSREQKFIRRGNPTHKPKLAPYKRGTKYPKINEE